MRLNELTSLCLIFFLPAMAQAQFSSTGSFTSLTFDNEAGIHIAHDDTRAESPGGNRFWVSAGLGPGSPGLTGVLAASYQFSGSNLLSLRGGISEELFGDGFWDVGLLYGRATTIEEFHASAAVGFGVIGGNRSNGLFTAGEDIDTQLGVPIEGQLYWRPLRHFGIGLYALANFNGEEVFGGLALSIQIGRFR